ncbi:thioredoxin, partial [Rhodococcus rhodochrous]
PLAGLRFECLGNGSSVDLAAALAGRPALVNLWAWWCGPCAEELPYLQEYAQRAGDAVAVVTVHTDPNEANALSRLAEYAVRLPGVQDGSARVQATVQSPPVLPVTVLIRPDGSVAKVLPQPFRSADEVAAAVENHLGVKV